MSKISYALLRRKRSPKTPNIPESTTFQDMHHHMRNMMTPDFSQTGKVFNLTATYTVHESPVHRYILRPTRTFQSRRWSPNQLFGNCCILSSATRIGIHLNKTSFEDSARSPVRSVLVVSKSLIKNIFDCLRIKFKINRCRILCHQLV